MTPHRSAQTGVTTLVVAMVLLIAATFITFFAAKVGVQEQRMSANDYRYKQGFNTGEALLERAKVFLASDRANFAAWPWTPCTAGQTTLPCGNGTTNVFDAGFSWIDVSALDADAVDALDWNAGDGPFILTENIGNSFAPVVLAARGQSDDNSGLALLRINQTRFNLLNPGPVPPLMAPNVATGGNLSIIGNPNHNLDSSALTLADCDSLTGSGQMLSVWSYDPVNFYGSMQTCQRGSYRDPGNNAMCIGQGIPDPTTGVVPSWNQCQCEPNANEKSPYSQTGDINDDVVQNDPDFPLEPFLYVFGRPKAAVKSAADYVLPNCSSLGPSSTGLYWITGDCQISANTVVGSRTAPVVLVSEGNFQFNSNSEVWGLVVGADMERNCTGQTNPNLCASPSPTDVKINGTFTLHGAMVVEKSVDIGNGTYNALYDPCVFAAMGAGTSFDKFGPVAGSWNDRL
jgi:hypothetical protein